MHLGKLVSLGPVVKFELFLDRSSKVFIHREAALQTCSSWLPKVHQTHAIAVWPRSPYVAKKRFLTSSRKAKGTRRLNDLQIAAISRQKKLAHTRKAFDELDSLVSHAQEGDLVLDYIVEDVLVIYVGHLAIIFRNLAKQNSRDCWEVTRGKCILGKNGRPARDKSVQDSHEQLIGKSRSDWIRRVVDHQAQPNQICTTLRPGNMQLGNWERDCDARDAPPSR